MHYSAIRSNERAGFSPIGTAQTLSALHSKFLFGSGIKKGVSISTWRFYGDHRFVYAFVGSGGSMLLPLHSEPQGPILCELSSQS